MGEGISKEGRITHSLVLWLEGYLKPWEECGTQVCGSGSLGVECVRWRVPSRWVPYVGGFWDGVNVWGHSKPNLTPTSCRGGQSGM